MSSTQNGKHQEPTPRDPDNYQRNDDALATITNTATGEVTIVNQAALDELIAAQKEFNERRVNC